MLYWLVFALVRLFFPRMRVIAAESLRAPGVFVCNHLGPFGPIAMTLYAPCPVRPWVSFRTTQKGLAAQEIAQNLFDKNSKVPQGLKNCIGVLLEIPALWAMRALKAIPVYFDATGVADTLNQSVHVLKEGMSIVVFADKDGDHADETVGGGIHAGCFCLARLHGRSAPQGLPFYPVHISRKKREIRIGMPVYAREKPGGRQETRRMAQEIALSLQALAAAPALKSSPRRHVHARGDGKTLPG